MGKPYRILVTGSRTWTDHEEITFDLAGLTLLHKDRPLIVVHGAASAGADHFAHLAAREIGLREEPHPAAWRQYGKAAGFRRNAEMVALGADVCLAYVAECCDPKCRRRPIERHGTHGAEHCADLAERAGIETRRFEPWRPADAGPPEPPEET